MTPLAQPLYAVVHVRLDGSAPLAPPAAPPGQGQYLVFWWKELALGHLFVEPGPRPAAGYHAALQAAVAPAVQHYAPALARDGAEWPASWSDAGAVARWGAGLDAALSGWLPPAPPPRVPVSVVVCTRDRAEHLQRCLQMLSALACAPAEIVVVDNAPTDARTQAVAEEFAGVVYVREPRPGLDIARNTGIRAATSPVVAFVDDDVLVHPWLLYRVWETFQDPTTMAMTGLVLALELRTEAQVIFERHWSFNRGYVDRLYDAAYLRAAPGHAPPVWEIGAGANMAFRKAVFEQVGYFDERLDVGAAGCSGDSEMWYRILAHGHGIRYNPRAVVHHEHRTEMAALKRQLFYYMRGHAAAALIQRAHQPRAGYARHLYWTLPRYYARQLRTGFPFFHSRGRTLWDELKGLASGVAFYYRNRAPAPRP